MANELVPEMCQELPDRGYDQLHFRLKQLREGDIFVPYSITVEGYNGGMCELDENETIYKNDCTKTSKQTNIKNTKMI